MADVKINYNEYDLGDITEWNKLIIRFGGEPVTDDEVIQAVRDYPANESLENILNTLTIQRLIGLIEKTFPKPVSNGLEFREWINCGESSFTMVAEGGEADITDLNDIKNFFIGIDELEYYQEIIKFYDDDMGEKISKWCRDAEDNLNMTQNMKLLCPKCGVDYLDSELYPFDDVSAKTADLECINCGCHFVAERYIHHTTYQHSSEYED